ncbi:glycosyltransferase family 2 [Bifidobacterium goeldii]|uniref:Glycosyltransferase family 2 n=2 Tax=Bifidobacterium goeldii TaxID=2306975 RepID=A0A430FFX8_9BIFI|nr:glycosyltransferase family 2 [Bifidobacterium goeldii]
MKTDGRINVSVVVPVYHPVPDLFDACLSSIDQQMKDMNGVECIIVCDGEIDSNLQKIIDSHSSVSYKQYVIVHSGVSSARNKGIQESRGDWILFVDADDILPDQSVKYLFEYAVENHCEIVQGKYEKRMQQGSEFVCYSSRSNIYYGNSLAEYRRDILMPDKGVSPVWGKIFYKKTIIENNISFEEGISLGEDTLFVFDVALKAERIGYIDQSVYTYVRNTRSAVSTFRQTYVSEIEKSMITMGERTDNAYRSAYQEYVLFHLLLVQQHYIFNQKSGWDKAKRKDSYKRIVSLPIFCEALKNKYINNFSLPKRIALYALKYRVYRVSALISYIRSNQIH